MVAKGKISMTEREAAVPCAGAEGMSDNIGCGLIIAIVVASFTACTISSQWIVHDREMKKTPLERCLDNAWREASRIECKVLYGAPK